MSRTREPQSHGLLLFRSKVDEDAIQGFSRWQLTCTSAIDGRSHENTRRVESPGPTHIVITGFDRTPTTSHIMYFPPANRFLKTFSFYLRLLVIFAQLIVSELPRIRLQMRPHLIQE